MASLYVLLALLLCYMSREPCLADDNTITTTKFLKDPQALVSTNGTFRLGFFSPDPSSPHRYLGIWFDKISLMTIVWVANRDKPINDSSGILKISDDGNLQLINGRNDILWSSNLSSMPVLDFTAQLLDSGNLILLHYNFSIDASLRPRIVWQSFDHPTDTFLPGMRAALPRTADKKSIFLRSWKTPLDPSDGSFSISMGTISLSQVFIWNNGNVYWKSGPWDGIGYLGDIKHDSFVNLGFSVEYNQESGTVEFSPQNASLLLSYKLDSQGILKLQCWNQIDKNWTFLWSAPSKTCDRYAKCGPFGSCNEVGSPICKCLRGFQPKNEAAWRKGNWSSGCIRRTQLQCGDQGGKKDGFLRLQKMKLPDNIKKQSAIDQYSCRRKCLNNCSCIAYAFYLDIGCMTWSKDLIDTQEYSVTGVDLFLRLAASELAEGKACKKTLIIASVAVIGGLASTMFVCFLWRWMTRRGKRVTTLNEHTFRDSIELQEPPPLFTFEMLKKATNNFQDSNKLGEGGFATVYKGILKDGNEIAVKRLSRASEQGLVEFMNEVAMISKLQHRNLVRLLGCCIKGDEKMLVYEYMPNKSLYAFLFDPQNRELLPWGKRRNIIEGICRGLVYLHRDSRLKIIHRDLTPSNILLDEHLNPKISDFGTARIFRGNQDQDNTRRVVGTYGYMSPEYTMGQFSEKSDVYSFGVILLEIVSGISNTSFHPMHHSCTLLGYAWKLWNEEKILSFIDPTISQPCFRAEILRCIHVGLLCVQKRPRDRPNISTLIIMLDTEIQLQHPERPAFTEWETSDKEQGKNTTAYTISTMQGR